MGRKRPFFVKHMRRKKRILMCSESHTIKSGFGRYSYEILSRLSKNPDYEIAEFASYLKDDQPTNVPWKVYPNAPKDDSEELKLYNNNAINQFGKWRFDKVVLHFKPDIVFDVRDYWMFSYQELSCLRPYYHWVVAPTIDSIPQKPEWLKTFENADLVLTHTRWASDYLKCLNRPINIGPCVSDSVNPEEFKPIQWTKNYHKTKFGIPRDAFIIGSVMRNQKRKLIAELFNSLRILIEKTKNNKIFLYLHTSYPENAGWNIPELLQEYGVYNNVLFTYYNPISKVIFPSLYKGPRINCVLNPNQYAFFPNVSNGVSNSQLCDIYNIFDIYVQYAICEGLGIPQLEAASCGIPLFAVNYSGMDELTSLLGGTKIKCLLSKELETGADRAVPDNNDLIDKIIDWLNKTTQEKQQISKNTRQLLLSNYSWDKTAEVWTKVFDGLEPKNIWDKPLLTQPDLPVPTIHNNRTFVYFIVNNLLKEPHLNRTHYIQSIIRSLDENFTISNSVISQTQRQDFVRVLEILLNNKIYCEKVRSGEISMDEAFLNR